jgi:AhpD family alkylhydroperoxidase
MARIDPPERPGALARLTSWYARRQYGSELAPTTDAWSHTPGLLVGYGAMEFAFERSRRLDRRLKLLAEMKAATVSGCEWCIDFGSMLSRAKGISEQQLRDLPRYRDSDAFSELEKLVLDYAAAMTRTPIEISDELFAALRRHLDERQIVELTNAVALENYRARFNWALGIESQGFSEGSFCAVPEREPAAVGQAAATGR